MLPPNPGSWEQHHNLLVRQIESDGFSVVPRVFDAECDELIDILGRLPVSERVRKRKEVYGVRGLLGLLPALVPLVCSGKMADIVAPVLGRNSFVVRSILFDKPTDANWMVPWHQDLTIAVNQRINVDGFGPWSQKAGIVHLQPPEELLMRMATVRVHLDDCDAENGALDVLPGSHRLGRLSAHAIHDARNQIQPVTCDVPKGGCLIMRPLLVHASKPSVRPNHRRVIHLEIAAENLPGELGWFEKHLIPASNV